VPARATLIAHRRSNLGLALAADLSQTDILDLRASTAIAGAW
jgi:hypothetical protein